MVTSAGQLLVLHVLHTTTTKKIYIYISVKMLLQYHLFYYTYQVMILSELYYIFEQIQSRFD